MRISVRRPWSPESITDLLKGQLGFNGLVVTDASHMIGMFGATIPRKEQVPGAIAAGCRYVPVLQ